MNQSAFSSRRIGTALSILLTAAIWLAMPSGVDAAPSAGQPPTDADINEAVEGRLFGDPAVPQRDIEVSTKQGIVTLSGSVPSLLAHDHAQKLTETVRGVRSIVNTLRVVPRIAQSDSDLQKDVTQALLYDAATDSYEIKATADKGTVFLRGKVDSFAERELAERVARGVSGVTSVKNELTVEVTRPRDDREVKAEVDARLRWDGYVDQTWIATSVRDGHVSLGGHVGSSAERTRAYVDAWVRGVKSVNVENLRVEPWAKEPLRRASKPYDLKDEDIKSAVVAALLYDPRVNSFSIDVTVRDNAVTLRGTVDNMRAQRAAVQDTRATTGVTRVADRIRVRSSNAKDDDLAKRIRAAFSRDPYVERFEILVSVHDGTAYLNGSVDSFFEKHQAQQLAASTQGVAAVRNRLVVYDDRIPLVWEPRVFDCDPYDDHWYHLRPSTSRMDAEVAANIADELFWSPFVDADQVNVKVDAGTATLRGTVDSYAEMRAAVANAYEGGAEHVTNKLRVAR